MLEPRIFWPIDKDVFRPLGLCDLIDSSMPADEHAVAYKQLLTYDYDKKDEEYSSRVLAADIGNAFDDDTRIIGYILFRKSWIRPNTFESVQTLVHADYRGNRIAALLGQAMRKEVRRLGGDYILCATHNPTKMTEWKKLDYTEGNWHILGLNLNSI